jgi:hypothetical protein
MFSGWKPDKNECTREAYLKDEEQWRNHREERRVCDNKRRKPGYEQALALVGQYKNLKKVVS